MLNSPVSFYLLFVKYSVLLIVTIVRQLCIHLTFKRKHEPLIDK